MINLLDLKKFEPEDAVEMAADAIEADITDIRQTAEFNAKAGPSYTGYYCGQKIGAAGIIRHKNGNGTAWLMLSKKVLICKKSAFRSMVKMMEILCQEFEFNTLRAQSEIGFEASQRLLEHLGFKQMRIMPNGRFYYYRKEVSI